MQPPIQLIDAHGGYEDLKAYQMAEIIYDATIQFCARFIDPRSRTTDQMVQAARSGKQNIAEGTMASGTSKKTEIRLVGVGRASLEELLCDYRDFLRQRGLPLWDKGQSEARKIRDLAYGERRTYATYKRFIEKSSAEVAANTMVCLIHQANYLTDQLLRYLDGKFLKEGGFSEKLYRERQKARARGRWEQ